MNCKFHQVVCTRAKFFNLKESRIKEAESKLRKAKEDKTKLERLAKRLKKFHNVDSDCDK